jgi:hypothetical protein
MAKPGRNDPCPCGSGNKYKKCRLAKEEAVAREQLAKAETRRAERAAETAAAYRCHVLWLHRRRRPLLTKETRPAGANKGKPPGAAPQPRDEIWAK